MVNEQKDDSSLVNVSVNVPAEKKNNDIIKSEELVTYYKEIIDDIRDDRQDVDDVLKNFKEMVINEGDSTQASKEALVNLIKIKSDMADKKTRVMDLLLRAFMRDRSIPGYLTQNNQFNIGSKNKTGLLAVLDEEKDEQK